MWKNRVKVGKEHEAKGNVKVNGKDVAKVDGKVKGGVGGEVSAVEKCIEVEVGEKGHSVGKKDVEAEVIAKR